MGFGSGTPQRKLARHRVAVDEDGRQDGDDMLARQLVFVCVGPDVCVCANCYFIRYISIVQGVPGIIASLALTKTLALICDIRKGRLSDVPAIRFEQRVFPAVPCFQLQ